MPVAGVMDGYAYRAANILANNQSDAAVVEMTLKGGTFYFTKDCYAAICGADMKAMLNDRPLWPWSAFFVPGGSKLEFQQAQEGCRTYLAVHGGIDVPPVLGSRSTFTRGVIGGCEGRPLKKGDLLPIGKSNKLPSKNVVLDKMFIPDYSSDIGVRVLPGPQDDLFTQEGIETFFNSRYTVSADTDRMGSRLEGPVVKHLDKPDIVSDALCPGSIQIPGHGMPIIMMADRQTTGGYTKIGTVIGADLWMVAQANIGDKLHFIMVNEEEAQNAFYKQRDTFESIKKFVEQSPVNRLDDRFRMSVNGVDYFVEITEGENKQ